MVGSSTPNAFLILVTKSAYVRWSKYYNSFYDTVSAVQFNNDFTKVMACLASASSYPSIIVVNAYDGTLISSFTESSGTSTIIYFKDGILVDSTDNLYLAYQNNNGKFEITKFSTTTTPTFTATWGKEISSTSAGNTYGTSLVFGGSQSEIFAGGYYKTTNNRKLAAFFRVTNTGTISWHYVYD